MFVVVQVNLVGTIFNSHSNFNWPRSISKRSGIWKTKIQLNSYAEEKGKWWALNCICQGLHLTSTQRRDLRGRCIFFKQKHQIFGSRFSLEKSTGLFTLMAWKVFCTRAGRRKFLPSYCFLYDINYLAYASYSGKYNVCLLNLGRSVIMV